MTMRRRRRRRGKEAGENVGFRGQDEPLVMQRQFPHQRCDRLFQISHIYTDSTCFLLLL
jgi:hypothetical protein